MCDLGLESLRMRRGVVSSGDEVVRPGDHRLAVAGDEAAAETPAKPAGEDAPAAADASAGPGQAPSGLAMGLVAAEAAARMDQQP